MKISRRECTDYLSSWIETIKESMKKESNVYLHQEQIVFLDRAIELIKEGGEELTCYVCKEEFDWEDGNDNRGSIYSCEKCGEYICISCMFENNLYKQVLKREGSIWNLEEILCLNCLEKKEKKRVEDSTLVLQHRVFHDGSYSVVARVWNPQKAFYEHPTLINLSEEDCVREIHKLMENPPDIQEIEREWELIGT